MNTKSVLGIIIVIIIIGAIVVWLRKTPPTPAAPSDQGTSQTPPVTTDAGTTTSSAQTTAPTTTPAVPTNTTTSDGLKIEVKKQGSGPAIANGQTAVMLYTGKLTDGTVFDSTANHGNQPFSFHLGAGEVIKGWDEGILGMKVGEERTLTIPASLGYGAAGYPPVIPQNATLVFDVTLVGIK